MRRENSLCALVSCEARAYGIPFYAVRPDTLPFVDVGMRIVGLEAYNIHGPSALVFPQGDASSSAIARGRRHAVRTPTMPTYTRARRSPNSGQISPLTDGALSLCRARARQPARGRAAASIASIQRSGLLREGGPARAGAIDPASPHADVRKGGRRMRRFR